MSILPGNFISFVCKQIAKSDSIKFRPRFYLSSKT